MCSESSYFSRSYVLGLWKTFYQNLASRGRLFVKICHDSSTVYKCMNNYDCSTALNNSTFKFNRSTKVGRHLSYISSRMTRCVCFSCRCIKFFPRERCITASMGPGILCFRADCTTGVQTNPALWSFVREDLADLTIPV